jgi:diguanylate cyclase (GGDEF)-like protein/PAS domain S-box-containing protein
MVYQVSPYSIAFLGTALISAIVAFTAWRKRTAPGGLWLFLMMAAVTEWALADSLEASAFELADKILWSKVAYVGAHASPPFFLLFALEYTHREKWLTPRNIALLFTLPALTITFAATNEWHHLIWTGFSPGPLGTNSYIYYHGTWFWVAMVFINVILFLGTLILLQFALRSREIYRYQSVGLIAGALVPWLGFAVYVLNINPFPGLDTTAISLAFSGVILAFIILRLQFLDVIPVAREALIEKMVDGLLVLDEQNRIVDVNPAAKRLLGIESGRWIGQRAEAVLLEQPDLFRRLDSFGNIESEFTLGSPETRRIDLRVSPLYNRGGKLTGRLIILQDVTSRKRAEEALLQANQELLVKLAEIERLQAKLREQAIRDLLTGLFNRRYLEETLERELPRASRKGYPVNVVMIDIDHFKKLNDTYGHYAGDLMLQALGGLLSSQTRAGDIACRYGGDEFVLMMPDMALETAFQRAETLRLAFQNLHLEHQGSVLNATFSAGIAVFPADGMTVENILHAVDQALYIAKTEGRNRTCTAR